MEGIAAAVAEPKTMMIDAICLRAHRVAANLRVEKRAFRLIGRTKSGACEGYPDAERCWKAGGGGLNAKLHALADANRPLSFLRTAGQVSDHTGAATLLDDLPKAQWLLGDRGYDADWFHGALQAKGIRPRISDRRSR